MRSSLLLFFTFSVLNFSFCALNQVKSKLLYENYEGMWRILNQNLKSPEVPAPFDQLEGKQGQILVYFDDLGHKTQRVQGVILQFLMPKYYDQNLLRVIINFGDNFQNQLNRWQGKGIAQYQIYEKTAKKQSGIIQLQYIADDSLIGVTINQNFSIVIAFQAKYLNPYTSFFFAFAAFVVFLVIRRKNVVEETNIRHQSITLILSIVMIFLIAVSELIIGFRSLFGTMSPQAFFTVTGFINLATFYQICRFYSHFIIEKKVNMIISFILSCLYIWFLLYFRHNYICLILNSLVFLPQIAYHSIRGQKIQGDFRFVFFVLSNQMYVIYFKSCPANMFKESPNYLLSYCIFSLLLFQVGLIIGQLYISPRFFIPSFFLPSQYNYYDEKNVKMASKCGNQCYICLQEIKTGKNSTKSGKNKKIMVTPCQHIFHADCLEKWMTVQMKCPVDRSDLPPI